MQRRPPPGTQRVTAVSNLALGSLLMALEVLDDWVDRNVPTQAQALEQRAKGQEAPPGALLPQSEWEATYRPAGGRSSASCRNGHRRFRQHAGRAGDTVWSCGPAEWQWTPRAGHWTTSSCSDRCAMERIASRKPRTNRSTGGCRRERALDTGNHAVAEVWFGSRGPGFRGYRDRGTPRPGAHPGDRSRRKVQASPRRSSRRDCAEHAVSLDLGIDMAWATLRGRPNPTSRCRISTWLSRIRSPIRRRWPAGPTSAAGTQGPRAGCWLFRVDVFALIIALIITFVFVRGVVFDLQP